MAALQPSDYATTDAYVAAVQALTDGAAHGGDANKAAEHSALFDLVPRDETTHVAVRNGRWTDPKTWWKNAIPDADSKALIPEAITVKYDANSSTALDTLRVDGELSFSWTQTTLLKLDTLVVSTTGKLEIGTTANPIRSGVSAKILIAANGDIDVSWDPFLLSRGVLSHGEVSIHGAEKDVHLKVATDPVATATTLTLERAPTGWEVGDKLVLTGTHLLSWMWDGSEISYFGTEDEELEITAINGAAITFTPALAYNHDTPADRFKASVANFTRNVVIETENHATVPVHQRAHVMWMHSDSISVRYAQFMETGRTDKSTRAFHVGIVGEISETVSIDGTAGTFTFSGLDSSGVDSLALRGFEAGTTISVTGAANAGNNSTFVIASISTQPFDTWTMTVTDATGMVDETDSAGVTITIPALAIASDLNVVGRYSCHFHRTGVDIDSDPAMCVGNAVWGSPGWGFVHHQSHVIMDSNASYNALGAHFVAEFGDEIGLWIRNIAITAKGAVSGSRGHESPKTQTDVDAFDLGRTGDGFWFQGRVLPAKNNIAAGCCHGFTYLHRGAPPGHQNELVDVSKANVDQPEIFRGSATAKTDKSPIQHFTDNEAFAVFQGVIVIKASPQQKHDVRSVLGPFSAWDVAEGMYLEYTKAYTILDLDTVGTNRGFITSVGLDFGHTSLDMIVNGIIADNFDTGVALTKTTAVNTPIPSFHYGVINPTITNTADLYDSDDGTDLFLTDAALVPGRLDFVPDAVVYSGSTVSITGTKTDSIGSVAYAMPPDDYKLAATDMTAWLENYGYYTDSGGTRWVVIEEYVADRATGVIGKFGVPIQLDPGVSVAGAIDNGAIDFTTEPAVAVDDTATTRPNTAVTINVLANDTDPGDLALSVSGTTQPRHGRVKDNGDGTIAYTPDRDFLGTDTFHYWCTNGHGKFSKGTVTVTVRKEGLWLRLA